MPQRLMGAAGIVLGLLGLLALACLVLVRADLKRAAATGPRWKRSLLAAGLLLLAAFGMARGQSARPSPEATPPPAGAAGALDSARAPAATQPASRLQDTKEWKELSAAWKDAEAIAACDPWTYPFDAKGKKALLDALDAAGKNVDRLQSGGELSAEESQVLKIDLARFKDSASRFRTTEERMATCYTPAFVDVARPAMERITARLSLLATLARVGRVNADVMAKALQVLEADVALLESPDTRRLLDSDAQKKVQEAVDAAREQLKKLRAATQPASAPATRPAAATAPATQPAKDLAETPEWKAIEDFWQEAAPLAESHKSTIAQRSAVAEKQKAGDAAAEKLAKVGLLAAAEAKLLQAEAARIVDEIHRYQPLDGPACYTMPAMIFAQISLERLTVRLEALKELEKAGKVQPAVWEKVLPAIQADLRTLADANQTEQLPDDASRQRADKVRADVEAAVKPIRARALFEEATSGFDRADRLADANERRGVEGRAANAGKELSDELIQTLPEDLREKARRVAKRANDYWREVLRKVPRDVEKPTCYMPPMEWPRFVPTRPDEEVIAARQRLLDACLARGAIGEPAYRKAMETLPPGGGVL